MTTRIIAEIGINHNGDPAIAEALVHAAHAAGVDAVKFQCGDPRLYVNQDHWFTPKETPWGVLSYIEYRERLELSPAVYASLAALCRLLDIGWMVSCLDTATVEWLERLGPDAYKVASPMLTHGPLLDALIATGRPLILSTGMSTPAQIDAAVARVGTERLALMHCTSEYPCPPERLNLRMIPALRARYGVPVGYSGHEVGLTTTVAAVALGAELVERHLTLSRAMWGSDQSASVEPHGFARLVRDIRTVEAALGDGVKHVYEGERANMAKFRRVA